jgi:hypothetical protein
MSRAGVGCFDAQRLDGGSVPAHGVREGDPDLSL